MPHHDAYGLYLADLDVTVVENSRSMQTTLRSMLANFGVRRIRTFDTGPEALTSMLADPPNVVITSWQMEPMSGARLISTMRSAEFPSLCRIPVITATAHATLSVIDRAFSVGANALLAKPLSSAVLRNRLEWLVRDAREMIEEDGRIVVDGIEHVLESRVRNSPLANAIMRASALEAMMRDRDDLAAGDEIDEPQVASEAEIRREELEKRAEERAGRRLQPKPDGKERQKKAKAKKSRRWHGWQIDRPKGSTAA